MLQHIHVKDLVIVRSLALDLAAGMTVLTGETGAGKSILIDALSLALGARADTGLVRNGSERAEVAAMFDLGDCPAVRNWLREHDLDDGDDCLLRRVLPTEGRSRCFINASPVPLSLARELGGLLVDIHGQHAHQSLLRRTSQRQLLDAFAGHPELLDESARAYHAYRQTLEELQQLRAAAQDRSSRIEFLRFQVQELDDAAPRSGELDALEEEQRRLANAEQLRGDTQALAELLYDADDAVQPALARAVDRLTELARVDHSLDETRSLLDSARIQVEEATAVLRDYADAVELDPNRLAEVDDRLGQLLTLARKHRLEADELASHHQGLRAELDRLSNADIELDKLETRLASRESAYAHCAEQLRVSRRKAAKRLARTISASMSQLGMSGGRFEIVLTELDGENAGAHGMDRIEFQVSANPGQPPGPLPKVASGGELSRISLAIQVATVGLGEVPTLIFDEVDVGIGGAVAEIVGQMLRAVGAERQVLVVTHLPQVAALGHRHLRVQKKHENQSTETQISELDGEARIQEVARMLGGIEITAQTRAHASEMIERVAAP